MSTELLPPTDLPASQWTQQLEGERVCLMGRFVSAPRKRLATLVAELGGVVVPQPADATLVVCGEGRDVGQASNLLVDLTITETELLERLGVIESGDVVKRLYTPAMLAELSGAPITAIRRWERRGYLEPSERLGRLIRYDFSEANLAQMLASLLRFGRSLAAIDRMVETIERAHPKLERPLVSLPLVAAEGGLLLRSGDVLCEPDGQRRLDFTPTEEDPTEPSRPMIAAVLSIEEPAAPAPAAGTIEAHRQAALELREMGDSRAALERFRLVMGAVPPSAEDHFTLAELLYETGEAMAARERYYAALELDPDYLEARLNLGLLLAAEGDLELAIAAFEGALDCYEPYADAHYHLAATFERAGQSLPAQKHWMRFLEIAPESPWADEARRQLEV
ncbi:MerR family transcriptional regulator [Botrimarina hoheduenensis]|uniref:MerR family transcriptional regulator n=1 Tax=Botrimarina hoheduenensis TaxID=2528000 RepID=UPI0011B840C4|nr:MerR family transcriptional regulator [Botrimarina hoheduenensis]